jgi:hypothetical protein
MATMESMRIIRRAMTTGRSARTGPVSLGAAVAWRSRARPRTAGGRPPVPTGSDSRQAQKHRNPKTLLIRPIRSIRSVGSLIQPCHGPGPHPPAAGPPARPVRSPSARLRVRRASMAGSAGHTRGSAIGLTRRLRPRPSHPTARIRPPLRPSQPAGLIRSVNLRSLAGGLSAGRRVAFPLRQRVGIDRLTGIRARKTATECHEVPLTGRRAPSGVDQGTDSS